MQAGGNGWAPELFVKSSEAFDAIEVPARGLVQPQPSFLAGKANGGGAPKRRRRDKNAARSAQRNLFASPK